ncbi:MAG: hypothetical protein M1834_004307 [Cirrosporium novae-zelandiae]|nr:MAG: hypothetical protein M1834_004307 [Cirrosporium novae-zelandiae]
MMPPSPGEVDTSCESLGSSNGVVKQIDGTEDLERVSSGPAAADLTSKEEPQEEPADPNVVGWDGDDDPENPMNWSASSRYGHVLLISAITMLTSLNASMFAPGVPYLMEDFDFTSTELASFVVSIYILGFGLGPLVLSPLSELYGRLIVYHISNVLFIIFTVACALSSNLPMLIVFRFLDGCAGSATVTIGGGTISDVIPQEKRGAAMAIFAVGPLIGPIVGPVAGGFLSQAVDWRWVFWVVSIAAGAVSILVLVCMRETYAITLLQRKTIRLRKETGNLSLVSKFHTDLTPGALFKRAIIRPTKLLLFSPIVLLLSLYGAIVYGYNFLLISTFTLVFEEQYGFTGGIAGLTYLGLGIGMMLGMLIFRILSDKMMMKLSANGEMKPEYRLPLIIYVTPLVPIGFFWYGWSAQAHTHWIVPIIGTSFIGMGMLCIFIPIQTYLIDAFPQYAASVLAANVVIRCIFGAVLPLAGERMYTTLGLGWGNSLLGFISIAFSPVPILFYRYGEYIRKRYPIDL